VELLKAGAADYLPKSELTPSRIAQCVRHALRVREISRQRTEAELKLHQSEACCRYLFEQFSDAVVIADSDGKVIEANAPACLLYRKSLEEMKEMSIAEIAPQDRPGEVSPDTQSVSAPAGGPPEGRVWVTSKFSVPMQVTTRLTARGGKPALLLHFRNLPSGPSAA
jgi:PAS domain S-box-containing protein